MSGSLPMSARSAATCLLGTGAALAGVGLIATSAWLVSRAAEQPNIATLSVAIVGVRFFGISRGLLRYAERLVGHDAALRSLADVRLRVYRTVATAPGPVPRAARSGDLLVRLVDDVDNLLDLMLRVRQPFVVAGFAGACASLVLALLVPVAGLVLAAALLLSATAVPALAVWQVRRSEARLAETRSLLSTVVVDLLDGAPDLIAYGAASAQVERVERAGADLAALQRAAAQTSGTGSALTALVNGVAFWIVLVVGVDAVSAGRLDATLLAVVVLTVVAAHDLMAGLPPAAAALTRLRPSRNRVAELLAAEPAGRPDATAPPGPAPCEVRGANLRARYDAGGHWALDGLDLELAPGSRVAVVGPSGAGKSTLAALLVRLVDPESGDLTVDGIPFADLAPGELRRTIALCEQDAHVFDGSIADNLRIGRPDASAEKLLEVLSVVGLTDWVAGLADRLDTPVGENGCRLSGGQRKRLVVARTLLAERPVLAFDEPTEHLDPAGADELMARLLEGPADSARLVVTHRLAGLELVPEILVLDHGTIVERGRHDELLERDGTYARMWQREVGCTRVTGRRSGDLIPPG